MSPEAAQASGDIDITASVICGCSSSAARAAASLAGRTMRAPGWDSSSVLAMSSATTGSWTKTRKESAGNIRSFRVISAYAESSAALWNEIADAALNCDIGSAEMVPHEDDFLSRLPASRLRALHSAFRRGEDFSEWLQGGGDVRRAGHPDPAG